MSKSQSWWKKRTKLERCLLASIILSTVVIIIFVANLLIGSSFINGVKGAGNLCMTEECVKTAANLIEKMDFSVNPCDDFYKFTCGNFIRKTYIPDDGISMSSFTSDSKRLELQYKQLLEKPINPNENKAEKLIKTLYQTCMNTTQIETRGLSYIKKIINETGGWPLLMEKFWNENNFDWKKLIYSFKKIGLGSVDFFSVYVDVDSFNSSKRVLTVTQASTSFQKQLLKGFNDTLIQSYYDYMVNVAVIFGADKRVALKELRNVIEFQIDLNKILTPWEKRRNSSLEYNPMTIREMHKKFPSIPWLQYINVILPPKQRVTADEVIIVTIPDYIPKLEELIKRTTKRTLANYLYLQTILNMANHLPESLNKKRLEFLKIAYGVIEEIPRWKMCLSSTGNLDIAAASVYVRHFFNEHHKHDVVELIRDIKSAFIEKIRKTTWMDSKTKKHALQKADKISSHIGYPHQLLDDKKIDEFYENLELNSEDYLQMACNISLFNRVRSFEKLRKPVDQDDWTEHSYSHVANAYYYQSENSISLPAGILHDFFYSSKRPQYLNYGRIGYIIGHEITHGFDEDGQQFDKNGNLVNWWQPYTFETFQKKAQCIIEQYGNYSVPEINLNLNGVKTRNEDIADNGGIKIAYMGYRRWQDRNDIEPMLPGLPYNARQMFWISAATEWCKKTRPEMLKNFLLSGTHSPSYFRVMLPFMNSGYFAKDFDCPLGTKMNPKKKCAVW